MNSFIYIDGIVLLITIFLFLVMILSSIAVVASNIRLENEKERLKTENKKLKSKLSITLDEHYRATFKVPDVDEDYHVVVDKSELGGEGDV